MAHLIVAMLIAAAAVALLAAMSLHANARFRGERRLPMQWWLDGSVTWTAPRPVALAFTPVLAALCATLLPLANRAAGQKPPEPGEVAIAAVAFIAVHALHLWLIGRTLRRRG